MDVDMRKKVEETWESISSKMKFALSDECDLALKGVDQNGLRRKELLDALLAAEAAIKRYITVDVPSLVKTVNIAAASDDDFPPDPFDVKNLPKVPERKPKKSDHRLRVDESKKVETNNVSVKDHVDVRDDNKEKAVAADERRFKPAPQALNMLKRQVQQNERFNEHLRSLRRPNLVDDWLRDYRNQSLGFQSPRNFSSQAVTGVIRPIPQNARSLTNYAIGGVRLISEEGRVDLTLLNDNNECKKNRPGSATFSSNYPGDFEQVFRTVNGIMGQSSPPNISSAKSAYELRRSPPDVCTHRSRYDYDYEEVPSNSLRFRPPQLGFTHEKENVYGPCCSSSCRTGFSVDSVNPQSRAHPPHQYETSITRRYEPKEDSAFRRIPVSSNSAFHRPYYNEVAARNQEAGNKGSASVLPPPEVDGYFESEDEDDGEQENGGTPAGKGDTTKKDSLMRLEFGKCSDIKNRDCPPPRSIFPAKMLFVVTQKDFYVMLSDEEAMFEAIMCDIFESREYKSLFGVPVQVGDPCIFRDPSDGCMHRAVMEERHPAEGYLYLMDSGCHRRAEHADISPILQRHCDLPPFAIHCGIYAAFRTAIDEGSQSKFRSTFHWGTEVSLKLVSRSRHERNAFEVDIYDESGKHHSAFLPEKVFGSIRYDSGFEPSGQWN